MSETLLNPTKTVDGYSIIFDGGNLLNITYTTAAATQSSLLKAKPLSNDCVYFIHCSKQYTYTIYYVDTTGTAHSISTASGRTADTVTIVNFQYHLPSSYIVVTPEADNGTILVDAFSSGRGA